MNINTILIWTGICLCSYVIGSLIGIYRIRIKKAILSFIDYLWGMIREIPG